MKLLRFRSLLRLLCGSLGGFLRFAAGHVGPPLNGKCAEIVNSGSKNTNPEQYQLEFSVERGLNRAGSYAHTGSPGKLTVTLQSSARP